CAEVAALVEDDTPRAVGLTPPDRGELRDCLAGLVSHRPGTQRQRARIKNLDGLRFPGKRRIVAFEKKRPSIHNLLLASQGFDRAEKYRFFGNERSEGLMVA